MTKPFLLLTGDDSVRAEGLILIKRIVEKFADFQIIATKEQHSACGAKLSLKGGEWGKEVVDGVEVIWLDGTPADSVFFAFDYLEKSPDLVISGLNFGENVSNGMCSSGTIGAAIAAAESRQTPCIAFSMVCSSKHWLKDHDGSFDSSLLEYPGEIIEKIIKRALELGIPERIFWNVNFPSQKTSKIEIVRTAEDGYWPNYQDIDDKSFKYRPVVERKGWARGTDSGELVKNSITVTPCKVEFTHRKELQRLKNIKFLS
ncbi:hypothetical protein GF362_06700 [Candidatus Dojkabacteria bacterium]|nr:hypothetical protein [Candidatus Dojkabacteria bacterium]